MRLILGVTVLLTASAVNAQMEKPDVSVYPEMSKGRALPLIAKALRDDLLDAGSVTNFILCTTPVKVKWKDGKPIRWTFMVSLNAKNSYGGYTGAQGMAVTFYADKPIETLSMDAPLSAKYLAGCTRVPDAEIRRLIQAE